MFGGLGGTASLVIILIAISLWGPTSCRRRSPTSAGSSPRPATWRRTPPGPQPRDRHRHPPRRPQPQDLRPQAHPDRRGPGDADQPAQVDHARPPGRHQPLQEGLNDTTREVESTRRSVNRGSVAERANGSTNGSTVNGTDAPATEPAAERTPGRAAPSPTSPEPIPIFEAGLPDAGGPALSYPRATLRG